MCFNWAVRFWKRFWKDIRYVWVLSTLLSSFSHGAVVVSQMPIETSCLGALESVEMLFWRIASAVRYGALLNPNENRSALETLDHANLALQVHPFTREELENVGWIREDETPVMRGKQKLAFKRIYLPLAHTGILVPKDPLDRKIHKAIILFIPGIGTTYSTAESVTDIAKVFADRKYRAELGDTGDPSRKFSLGFRGYSVALDATLNGMAEGAPGSLGTARGSLAITYHALLVLKALYPDLGVVIAGRSQGGTIALAMSLMYGPLEGLDFSIALNPSPTDLRALKRSVKISESGVSALLGGGFGMKIHPRSMLAYRTMTPNYRLSGPSQSPSLILQGKEDPSYEPTSYGAWLERFLNEDSTQRQIRAFGPDFQTFPKEFWRVNFGHDLWRRGAQDENKDEIENPVREEVIAAMAEAIQTQLKAVSFEEIRERAIRRVTRSQDRSSLEWGFEAFIVYLADLALSGVQKEVIWKAILRELRDQAPYESELLRSDGKGSRYFSLPQKRVLRIDANGSVFVGSNGGIFTDVLKTVTSLRNTHVFMP